MEVAQKRISPENPESRMCRGYVCVCDAWSRRWLGDVRPERDAGHMCVPPSGSHFDIRP